MKRNESQEQKLPLVEFEQTIATFKRSKALYRSVVKASTFLFT